MSMLLSEVFGVSPRSPMTGRVPMQTGRWKRTKTDLLLSTSLFPSPHVSLISHSKNSLHSAVVWRTPENSGDAEIEEKLYCPWCCGYHSNGKIKPAANVGFNWSPALNNKRLHGQPQRNEDKFFHPVWTKLPLKLVSKFCSIHDLFWSIINKDVCVYSKSKISHHAPSAPPLQQSLCFATQCRRSRLI